MEEPLLKPARADFAIRPARPADVPELLRLIRELAAYEKLEDMAVGTVPMLSEALFGARPAAEAMVAERSGRAVGFALYFTTFSTFLCKPGLYLEDQLVGCLELLRGYPAPDCAYIGLLLFAEASQRLSRAALILWASAGWVNPCSE